mmetsp:Transcript_1576/g.1676  ORF Transcript_1576/g.1676 Transcript_1576/m.1676 type:complete len:437 (+) Transcript_1576:130-1440(+)
MSTPAAQPVAAAKTASGKMTMRTSITVFLFLIVLLFGFLIRFYVDVDITVVTKLKSMKNGGGKNFVLSTGTIGKNSTAIRSTTVGNNLTAIKSALTTNETKSTSNKENSIYDSSDSNNFCNKSTNIKKRNRLKITGGLLFLHLGKGGGGTVKDRLKNGWKINFDGCHPRPCNPKKKDKKNIWINIRDPIDRFVSAFNWGIVITCDPKGDTRITRTKKVKIVGQPNPTKKPEKYCYDPKEKIMVPQSNILFQKYNKNVNALAEALCHNNTQQINRHSNSIVLDNDVKKDIKKIRHAESTIGDWLKKFDWKDKKMFNIVPIIAEKGFDFNEQIDDGIVSLYNTKKIVEESPLDFACRKQYVQQSYQSNANSAHSSQAYSKKQVTLLSERGKQCLAEYFRNDYNIISELQTKRCTNENCRNALQSILDRRANLLSTPLL